MSSVARTFGRYDLLLELSKGPFGSLWMARETGTTNDVVMLRRLSIESSSGGPDEKLLASATEWAQSVRGSGILEAIASVVADGEVGLVTKHHPGEPLRSLLRLANFKRRAFVPGASLRVALDVLSGLESLSKAPAPPAGVPATTALLPDSIVVGTDGRSMVIDVGISAVIRRNRTQAMNPDVASYLAPEELGEGAKVDERTSVFSIGVLLWEMMSGGRRLFSGNTPEGIVERIQSGGAPRLDAARPPGGGPIPKPVADLVARALECDPERRFPNLEALRAAIVGLGSSVTGTPAEVSAIVTALAGNALTARERSIQRATDPSATAEPERVAEKAAAPVAETPTSPAAAPATPALSQPKKTLLGMAPAKPSRMPSLPDAASAPIQPRPATASATETPKPVTPPLPIAVALANEHPELTPASAAARLSLLKPPKPAGSRPAGAQPTPKPADVRPPAAAKAPVEEEASDDRRLLDALTLEPAPSERSPSIEASRTRPSEQRDSVTPPESLTASKDSVPPSKQRVPAGAGRARALLMAAAVVVGALVLVAVALTRRTTRAPTSEEPTPAARPSAELASPPEPAPSPAKTPAPAVTPEPAASTTPSTEPSAVANDTAEPPSPPAPVTAAANNSAAHDSAPARSSTRAPTRTSAPSTPARHTTTKPAKRPARFTPPDI